MSLIFGPWRKKFVDSQIKNDNCYYERKAINDVAHSCVLIHPPTVFYTRHNGDKYYSVRVVIQGKHYVYDDAIYANNREAKSFADNKLIELGHTVINNREQVKRIKLLL